MVDSPSPRIKYRAGSIHLPSRVRNTPLSDCRVLDLTDEKGAFCIQLLAEMGAEVVRVENPTAQVKEWAKTADVIVESFTPGYLKELGLDYPALSQLNPRLVMASITPFGQNGPYANYKATDITISALSGQLYVNGESDTPPLKPYGNQTYYTGSLFAAIGIMLALQQRHITGKGQYLDISLQECAAATIDHVLVRYFAEGIVAKRRGSLYWNNAFRIFPGRDGYILLTLFQQWETLLEWLADENIADDLTDAKYLNPDTRLKSLEHIIDVLERWTRTHTVNQLVETGQLMHFPWAEVAPISSVLENPQLKKRGFFSGAVDEKTGNKYKIPEARNIISAPFAIPAEAGIHKSPMTTQHINKLRILDFSWVLAGPYATRLLADFGAEVIKVNSPHQPVANDAFSRAYFDTWNRNKRSITLNLNQPAGVAIAKRLLAISDVVVENFTPRVMANWGLDYQNLKKLKPDVIMVSLSAMGHTGPLQNYVGYGPTVHALSGMTSLTSFPGRPPTGLGFSYADHIAGLFAAFAILGALEQKRKTGAGQYIDISETEVMASLLGDAFLQYSVTRKEVEPLGNSSYNASPHGVYRCRGNDRWVAIAVTNQNEWHRFQRAVGLPWTKERKFATLTGRLKNRAELDRLVEEWTREQTAQEVMTRLQSHGVPAGIVQNAAGLANDPQLKARGFFIKRGDAIIDANPIRLSQKAVSYCAAPSQGQDNDYVYGELLRISRKGLEALKEIGII